MNKVLNFSKTFPVLYTKRLILRQITFDDKNDVLHLRSNEQIMFYIRKPRLQSLKDTRQFINGINNTYVAQNGITWGITLRSDFEMRKSKLIGMVDLKGIQMGHFRAELGCLLHPHCQGKGIMQEALTEVVNYAFTQIKLHSLEANVDPHNQASIKLLKRIEFQKEGYLKENWCYLGQFSDTIVYSRLNPYD